MFFLRYDKDKNGYLDSKELKTMIRSLNSEGKLGAPSEIEILSFASQIDANHNGRIDKQELFSFLKSNLI
jgi:Ca2+-binding EF-hand superfamily protein